MFKATWATRFGHCAPMASCQVSQGFASSALTHFKLKRTDWSHLENTWQGIFLPPTAASRCKCPRELWLYDKFACRHCFRSVSTNSLSTVRPCWSDLVLLRLKVVLEFPHVRSTNLKPSPHILSEALLSQRDRPSIASCHCAPTLLQQFHDSHCSSNQYCWWYNLSRRILTKCQAQLPPLPQGMPSPHAKIKELKDITSGCSRICPGTFQEVGGFVGKHQIDHAFLQSKKDMLTKQQILFWGQSSAIPIESPDHLAFNVSSKMERASLQRPALSQEPGFGNVQDWNTGCRWHLRLYVSVGDTHCEK